MSGKQTYGEIVQTAIDEATRFIEKATDYRDNVHKQCGRDHAAMLRASMDLSHALADVRRR